MATPEVAPSPPASEPPGLAPGPPSVEEAGPVAGAPCDDTSPRQATTSAPATATHDARASTRGPMHRLSAGHRSAQSQALEGKGGPAQGCQRLVRYVSTDARSASARARSYTRTSPNETLASVSPCAGSRRASYKRPVREPLVG